MASIEIFDLSADHEFGARISGVTAENLKDEAVCRRIRRVFEERGVVLFEGVEPTGEMHLAISNVFGPLQPHAYKGVPLVDAKRLPGVISISSRPGEQDVFKVNGELLSSWIPWHFDACYTARLNRGGVLRALQVPPKGGATGFADGVQMYRALSRKMRERFERLEILYHPALMFTLMRFGVPTDYQIIDIKPAKLQMIEDAKPAPHAIHPAIWRRATGEFVLHVSPWQADGIVGMTGSEGDELLEELCQEMLRTIKPYYHSWQEGEMIMWDNWRCLHMACGHAPDAIRVMHRTTIEGDYGLGRFQEVASLRS